VVLQLELSLAERRLTGRRPSTSSSASARDVRSIGPELEHQVIEEIQARAARPALELTERERAVLELAVKGLTVAGMGKQLHLSPATIKVHLSTLYAKLGVSDRASAVAEAIRRGLVQ
jgi:two-component system nitrate/nitrite response regulator NarL